MKYWMLALCILIAPKLFAGHYEINPELSALNFATTKKQYIIEPATISKLSGALDKSGKFVAHIDLKNLDTINPIRDGRLRDLFFEYDKYPSIEISAHIDPHSLPKTGEIKSMMVKGTLKIWQGSKELDLELLVANTGRRLMVSSRKAVLVSASDFGIPNSNLSKLAGTVGNIDIASSAAVNVQLVLDLKAD
ncbi:MAG: YceI family protein [Cellvibrionaceae bacterium]|nr:YceI family protein [Cellvibrionaceae bacterium]